MSEYEELKKAHETCIQANRDLLDTNIIQFAEICKLKVELEDVKEKIRRFVETLITHEIIKAALKIIDEQKEGINEIAPP